jgi:hypothetical protein
MKRLLGVVLLASCLSCARTPEDVGEATVVRDGFSIRDDRIGIGAIVRVDGHDTVRDIALTVSFRVGSRMLATEHAILPHCPPRTDCPWGQMLFGDRLHKAWRNIDRVDIDVLRTGHAVTGSRSVVDVRTMVRDGAIEVHPDGRQGTAFVIAYEGARPVAGYSFFAAKGVRDALRYGPTLFPRLRTDAFATALYPGPTPKRE